MTLRFDDADMIATGCKAFIDRNEMPDHPVTMKRVKSAAAAAN